MQMQKLLCCIASIGLLLGMLSGAIAQTSYSDKAISDRWTLCEMLRRDIARLVHRSNYDEIRGQLTESDRQRLDSCFGDFEQIPNRTFEQYQKSQYEKGKLYEIEQGKLDAKRKKAERDAQRAYQEAQNRLEALQECCRIGMTKAQVLAARFGSKSTGFRMVKPQSVNRTVTAAGTHEQWVMGGGVYLYFDPRRLLRLPPPVAGANSST